MAAEEEFKRADERATDDYVTERNGRFRDEPGLFEVEPGRPGQPA